MNQRKKSPNPAPSSHLGNPNPASSDLRRRMGFRKEFEETNESEGCRQTPSPLTPASSKTKKKILGERNSDDPPLRVCLKTHLAKSPQQTPAKGSDMIGPYSQASRPFSLRSPPILASSGSVYDPVKNYTSPRPTFLRYNPNRRREIIFRRRDEEGSGCDSHDQEKSADGDSSSLSSSPLKPTSSQDEVIREVPVCASHAVADEGEEEEAEAQGRRPRHFGTVWKMLFLFGVLLISLLYLFPMESPSSSPFQESISSTRNLSYRDSLKAHLGLSDVCLDTAEGTCSIESPGSDLVSSDEPEVGYLDDSTKIEFLNEAGVLDVDDKEFSEGIEVIDEVKKEDEDLMEVDSIEERIEEPVGSLLFSEQEHGSQGESSGQEGILGAETIENPVTTSIMSEFVQNPDGPFVDNGSQTYENVYAEVNSGNWIQGDESIELTAPAEIPELQSVLSTLHEDQDAEEFDFLAVNLTSLRWKNGVEVATRKFWLIFLPLCLLVLAIATGSLLKYLRKSHQKSSLLSSSRMLDRHVDERNVSSNERKESVLLSPVPVSFPSSQSVEGKEIHQAATLIEEMKDVEKDSNVTLQSSDYSYEYAARPPIVELLGEFSLADSLVPKATSGQKLKRAGHDKSQGRIPFEDFLFSPSERKRTVKTEPSPTSSGIQPDYTPAPLKQVEKETYVEKREVKKPVNNTPLRRSSRLQNQGISTPKT